MLISGSYILAEYAGPPPASAPRREKRPGDHLPPGSRDGRDGMTIQAVVAANDAERARGLSEREALDPKEGMIFVYEPPEKVAMWSQDTGFPLDMIFIRKKGVQVAGISRGVPPYSEEVIKSPGRVGAVLATAAGAWPGLIVGDALEITCIE